MKFVCWLWHGHAFRQRTAKYGPQHVTLLAAALRRYGGHDLVCITDEADAIRRGIDVIDMPPHVASLPDYLPKLWAWSADCQDRIGGRFISIDLDVIITGDVGEIFANDHAPFRIWNKAEGEPYNSSLFVLQPGYGREVWDSLSVTAAEEARASSARWTGDQSWIARILGPDEHTFGEDTGIIQYRPHHRQQRPPGLRAGFMCGPYEPFSEAKVSLWVEDEINETLKRHDARDAIAAA